MSTPSPRGSGVSRIWLKGNTRGNLRTRKAASAPVRGCLRRVVCDRWKSRKHNNKTTLIAGEEDPQTVHQVSKPMLIRGSKIASAAVRMSRIMCVLQVIEALSSGCGMFLLGDLRAVGIHTVLGKPD